LFALDQTELDPPSPAPVRLERWRGARPRFTGENMEKVEWTPEMSLGVEPIDAAHQDLLAQMNGLLNGSDSDVAQGMEQLVTAMERDFREEEELMEKIGYPGIRPHMEQHARVLAALHRIDPGDVAAARTALELLPQWFEVHLATLDTALAVALDLAGTPPPA
jgi:hemerythrin